MYKMTCTWRNEDYFCILLHYLNGLHCPLCNLQADERIRPSWEDLTTTHHYLLFFLVWRCCLCHLFLLSSCRLYIFIWFVLKDQLFSVAIFVEDNEKWFKQVSNLNQKDTWSPASLLDWKCWVKVHNFLRTDSSTCRFSDISYQRLIFFIFFTN